MSANGTRQVMDAQSVQRTLVRIAHEILERNKGTADLALIGIRSRGVHIADRIAATIQGIEEVELPRGIVDITLYRDDLSRAEQTPHVRGTEIPLSIEGKRIVLIDDVLYTGRTIRAAMDALMDFGRPENIQLAVMIDRGHRELPIRADYVGKNLPTSRQQSVQVRLVEMDGVDDVIVEG
ncbi:MAG: bifunctional pyr operon transcriptional regulator/uracil phosphoribosyltransferase PyrR [Candidatus Binatia bacterium]